MLGGFVNDKFYKFFSYCDEGIQNTNEYNISRVLIKHFGDEKDYTLQTISDEAAISTASVSRFINKCGFESFQELKRASLTYRLNMIHNRTTSKGIKVSKVDDLSGVGDVKERYISNIEKTFENLDLERLKQICEKLLQAKSITILGGTSELAILIPLRLDLCANGVPTYMYMGEISQAEHARFMGEGEILLYFAVSAHLFTKVEKESMENAREKGGKIIAFAQDRGYLEEYVDEIFYYGEEDSGLIGYSSLCFLTSVIKDLIYQI